MGTLLFSIEDIALRKGFERVKETYFVMFGYAPEGNAEEVSFDGCDVLRELTGEHAKLKQWFFLGYTPIFPIKKGIENKHPFPGGLPLYSGPKTEPTSVYLAVMEHDGALRDAGQALGEFIGRVDTNPLMDAALKLAAATQPQAALVKNAFALAIKGVEVALIRNRDDIDYTNVFTFKGSNGFLVGTHSDWGNHRVDMTFSVEIGEDA